METRMKLRIPLLVVASLLLTVSLASAETAVPAQPLDLGQIISTPATPGCNATANPTLGSVPTILPAAATCGTCSTTICAGKALHSFCKFQSGRTYTCEAVLGNTCGGGTLTFDCSCWTGPLP